MIDKEELCQRIIALYPDIGECGIDVNVDFDEGQNAWVVDLKNDWHELKTFRKKGMLKIAWGANSVSASAF